MDHDYDQYDPLSRYPPSKVLNMISGSASFPLLELILDPTRTPPPHLRDAILVSFDLKSRVIESVGKIQITQLGIVSLDTRILTKIDPDDSEALVNAIQSRVFNVYPKRQASRRVWVPKSLWAKPETIRHDEVCDKLNEIFLTFECDPTNFPTTIHEGPRNIILIGHSVHSDRSLLKKLFGFDIKYIPSIKAILDTGKMMCCAYEFGIATHSHFPLRLILRCLGIRYDQLHDAGNDAMFTMKALLLMFSNWRCLKGRHLWNTAEEVMLNIHSLHSKSINTKRLLWDCQLEVLTAIAREPWPMLKKPATRRSTMLLHHTPKTPTDLLLSPEDLDLTQMFS